LQGKGLSEFVSSSKVVKRVEKSGCTCQLRNLALLDHREDSSNVFSHNPSGPDLVDAAIHIRPEVAVIIRASSLPGIGEGLARKAACEDIDLSLVFCEVCCFDVFIRI
jgi:hypothetical protein